MGGSVPLFFPRKRPSVFRKTIGICSSEISFFDSKRNFIIPIWFSSSPRTTTQNIFPPSFPPCEHLTSGLEDRVAFGGVFIFPHNLPQKVKHCPIGYHLILPSLPPPFSTEKFEKDERYEMPEGASSSSSSPSSSLAPYVVYRKKGGRKKLQWGEE